MPDEGQQTQTTDGNTPADGQTAGTTTTTTAESGRTFSQAELDRVVEDRIARERKRFADYADLKKKADEFDKAQDAQKSELEKAQEQARKADEARVTALSSANTRLITAEARVRATALGVKPDRIPAALKLADLSKVDVGEDGEPDAAAITAALEQVLKDVPELKVDAAAAGTGTSAANPARAGATAADPKNLPRLATYQWKT